MALKAERGDEPRRRAMIPTPTAGGFLAQEPLPASAVLRGVGDDGTVLGEAVVRGVKSGTSLDAAESVRDGARFLETTAEVPPLLVVIHRTEDVAKNLGGDTRKALRQALGALEEDPSQLETLLKLTEKVILDSDDVVRTTPLRSGVSTPPPSAAAAPAASLALDAAGRKTSRRRRSMASGEIRRCCSMPRCGASVRGTRRPRRRRAHAETKLKSAPTTKKAVSLPESNRTTRPL